MGQTFVYNAGKSEVEKKHLEVRYGVFIDGTLNNKKNTELRRKYRNNDVENLSDEDRKAMVKKDEDKYDALKNKEITKDTSEEDRYLIASHRTFMDKRGTDNSYSNDVTNIARMWYCCKKDYRIYVEGMGTGGTDTETEEILKDSQDGFAFGSGKTGMRAKVRKGCEFLAKKIIAEKMKDKKKILTQITIDAFGFSRGAASARNFIYEIRKKAYPSKPTQLFDGYYPGSGTQGAPPVKKYKTVDGDVDRIVIDPSLLHEGKLPPKGHLGYCLLKSDLISLEELENLKVVIHFLGVYETVSSYYERNDRLGIYNDNGEIEDDGQWGKLATQKFDNQFLNNVEPLHLNDFLDENISHFGSFYKAVHFIAQDEHRVNFDLTLMPRGLQNIVEKSFPGVHCDIGGAYENEIEEKEKLELARFYYGKLADFRQQLIDEHWFKEDQIDIDGKFLNFISNGLFARTINTKRFVRKEYSYIPLHFMEQYARTTSMDNYFKDEVLIKYPLNNDFLESVKGYMSKYVFDETGEVEAWSFVSDEKLKSDREEKEAKKAFLDSLKSPQKPIPYINERRSSARNRRRIPARNRSRSSYVARSYYYAIS